MGETVRQNFYAREITGLDDNYELLKGCFQPDDDGFEDDPPYFRIMIDEVRPYRNLAKKWYAVYAETEEEYEWDAPDGFANMETLRRADSIIERACARLLAAGIVLGPVSYHTQSWHNGSDRPPIMPEKTKHVCSRCHRNTVESDEDSACECPS